MLYVGSGEAEVGGGAGAEAGAEPPLATAGPPWAARGLLLLPPLPPKNPHKLSWLIPLRKYRIVMWDAPRQIQLSRKSDTGYS